MERESVRALVRSGKSARQRTIPYLGIACLALLAFTGVYAVPEMGALGEAPALGLPAFTWMDERAAPPGPGHRVAPRLMGRHGPGWLAAAFAPAHIAPVVHVAATPTPRARGALALPALLIAVALARTH